MSELKRRDFLKTTVAGIAAGTLLKGSAKAENNPLPAPEQMAQTKNLPDIPTCDSMRSVVMTHKFGDLFNPPGLTNQWGLRSSRDGRSGDSEHRFSAVRAGRNERRAFGRGRRTFNRSSIR